MEASGANLTKRTSSFKWAELTCAPSQPDRAADRHFMSFLSWVATKWMSFADIMALLLQRAVNFCDKTQSPTPCRKRKYEVETTMLVFGRVRHVVVVLLLLKVNMVIMLLC